MRWYRLEEKTPVLMPDGLFPRDSDFATVWASDPEAARSLAAIWRRSEAVYALTKNPWLDGHGDEMDAIYRDWAAALLAASQSTKENP